jgi:hypothetical protein
MELAEDLGWLNMTPEDRAVMRRRWLEALYSSFSPEEIISRYKPEEILSVFTPEERLKGMKPEELEAYLLRIKGKQAGKIPKSE